MAQQPLSFRLPDGKTEEVILVRLADGRVVARTRGEVAELPPEMRGEIEPAPEK